MATFSTLAAELQDLIWEYAVLFVHSRKVALRVETNPQPDFPFDLEESVHFCFTSSAPIPSLLHVCHRSRYFATKRWQPTFRSLGIQQDVHFPDATTIRRQSAPPVPKVWFDYQSDVLFLLDTRPAEGPGRQFQMSFYHSRWNLDRADRDQVRNVALDISKVVTWDHIGPNPDADGLLARMGVLDVFTAFPGARKIYLVLKPDVGRFDGTMRKVVDFSVVGERWKRRYELLQGDLKEAFRNVNEIDIDVEFWELVRGESESG